MLDFVSPVIALKKIVYEKQTVRETLFSLFHTEKLSKETRDEIREIVIGVLKHYQSLTFEAMNMFLFLKRSDEILLIIAALYEERYLHYLSYEDFEKAYQSTIEKLRLNNIIDEAKMIFSEAMKPFTIPEEVKASPYLYNSLSLETPEFLLKEIADDFSPENTKDIALSLHLPSHPFYQPLLSQKEEKIEGLTPVKIAEDNTIYQSKKELSPKEIKDKNLLPIGYLEAVAYSKVNLPSLSTRVLVIGDDASLYPFPLAYRLLDSFDSKVYVAIASPLKYRSVVERSKSLSMSNLKAQLTQFALAKTYFEYNSFDLVVYVSASSDIGLSRNRVEILPALEENDIQREALTAKEQLQEASLFVKKTGQLLFLSHSFLKREGKDITSHFLSSAPFFYTVEEQTILNETMDSDGGYFALLEQQHD